MNTLVVGSSVIDLFVRAKDETHTTISDTTVTLTLGDKIPIQIDNLTIGGNGSNVAAGLKKLEIPVTFYTYLGKDILSKKIEQTIQDEGVDLIGIRGDNENSSLSIILHFAKDRIIFSHHEIHKHDFTPPKDKDFEMIYLTSIGNYWEDAYKNVLSYVKSGKKTLAFSPGSSQLVKIDDLFFETLAVSKLLFLNKEEAEKIVQAKGKKTTTIEELIYALKELGPSVISMTHGGEGSYALDENNKILKLKPFGESINLVEKTGAGDSYAAGFLASFIHGNSITESMKWGAINAHQVMRSIGAHSGLLSKEEIVKELESHKEFTPDVL